MRFSYPKINVKIKIFVVNLLQMLLKVSIFVFELSIAIIFNGSQLTVTIRAGNFLPKRSKIDF